MFRSRTFRTRSFCHLTFLVQDAAHPGVSDQVVLLLDILDQDVLPHEILDQGHFAPGLFGLDVSHPGRLVTGLFGPGCFAL